MADFGIRFVRAERTDRIMTAEFGVIGWGGNGGFQAINLAVQFGVRKIILVGFDMRVDKGVHWHGKHGYGMNNPTTGNVARWRVVADKAAPALAALGVEVVNVSPVSALTAYPKMTLEEALA